MSDKTDPGSGIGDAIGGIVDGSMKLLGLKEGGLSGFAERLGVALTVAVPAVVLHSRFVVKPAIQRSQDANLIMSSIPLSSFTFGSTEGNK